MIHIEEQQASGKNQTNRQDEYDIFFDLLPKAYCIVLHVSTVSLSLWEIHHPKVLLSAFKKAVD